MFLSQDLLAKADHGPAFLADPEYPLPRAPARLTAAQSVSGGRYGEGRKASIVSAGLAVAVHMAIVPLLLGIGYQSAGKREDRLVAINLSPPPAAPPAKTHDRPKPKRLETQINPPQAPQILPVNQPLMLPAPDIAPRGAFVPAPVAPAPSSEPSTLAVPTTVSSDYLSTRMVAGSPPRYPLESRRRKEQGTVKLLLVLNLEGAVETISIASSSSFDRLDAAALSAVRHWRWQPTLQGGVPVKVKGVVEIPFVLKAG